MGVTNRLCYRKVTIKKASERVHYVELASIRHRYVKDQISRNFPLISMYIFDVIPLVEKSTSFPRTFFDVISKATLFARTFFDEISLVKKFTLFARTFLM